MIQHYRAKLPIISWCSNPEEECLKQATDLGNHSEVFHHVALMPDTHVGYGMPIGGVAAFKDCICPNAVGVDIACGMLAMKIDYKASNLSEETLLKIIRQIKRDIPLGFNHQSTDKWKDKAKKLIDKHPGLDTELVAQHIVYGQLGTLGGGNHFIEIQKDEEDYVWIMIHSGSRNIGNRVAKKYHAEAKEITKDQKNLGMYIPNNDLAVLPFSFDMAHEYLKHMNFCVDFSFENRICMMNDVMYAFKRYVPDFSHTDEFINIHHNYAAEETHFGESVWVHRKGATSAKKDEIGIIPGSMGTTSYIVKGKGCKETFESCSHGAGRTMSRSKAKKTLDIDEFKNLMTGVISTDIDKKHLDESPLAYKRIETVMLEQVDLVDIVHSLTPIANIKG